jgi:MSHA pilin protein MshA
MKKQGGFTLIELIIVIVILGILAAFAVPRYIGLDKHARVSTVKGLEGSIRAASEMVHGAAIVKGNAASTTADLGDGLIVDLSAGRYPAATNAGIGNSLSSTSGFTVNISGGTIYYEADGANDITNCRVGYAISGSNPPTITWSGNDTTC